MTPPLACRRWRTITNWVCGEATSRNCSLISWTSRLDPSWSNDIQCIDWIKLILNLNCKTRWDMTWSDPWILQSRSRSSPAAVNLRKVCMFYYNICCSQFQQHYYRKHVNMFNRVHSSVFIIMTLVMSLLCRCFSMATNSQLIPSAFDQFLGFLAGSTVTILEAELAGKTFWNTPWFKWIMTSANSTLDYERWRPLWLVFFSERWIAMLLASKIRRCIEQIIQCPLILTFDSIQPGLEHSPINFQQWMLMDILRISKIIITCHHRICWFGLPLLAFTHWCLCMVSFLPESCHRLAISRRNPRRGTSLNIVSTREHSPRLNCEDLPTWVTKTHSLHEWQIVLNSASSGKIKAENMQRTMDAIEPERIWMKQLHGIADSQTPVLPCFAKYIMLKQPATGTTCGLVISEWVQKTQKCGVHKPS